VQQGAPLVEIDTRPYQVALEQAEGQQLRDKALLDNANVDLSRYAGLLKQERRSEQQYATQKALVAQEEGWSSRTRARLMRPSSTGLLPHHVAHHRARSACAWWMPATSCMLRMPPAWWSSPRSANQRRLHHRRGQAATRADPLRAGQQLSVEAWDRDAGTFSDPSKRLAHRHVGYHR